MASAVSLAFCSESPVIMTISFMPSFLILLMIDLASGRMLSWKVIWPTTLRLTERKTDERAGLGISLMEMRCFCMWLALPMIIF